jgi:hypothetical protein
MAGPVDLGFYYGDVSSNPAVPITSSGSSIWNTIGSALSDLGGSVQNGRNLAAQRREANARALQIETELAARQKLGRLIADQFQAPGADVLKATMASQGVGVTQQAPAPIEAPNQTVTFDANTPSAEKPNDVVAAVIANIMAPKEAIDPASGVPASTTVFNPSPAEVLAAQREHAAMQMTPEFVAQVANQGVNAGEPGTGANIGSLLANVAVAARDADSAAGFRGQPLSPGQSVFQTDAHRVNEFEEAQTTARQDSVNATALAANELDNQTSRRNADVAAAVNREQNATADRASQVALEQQRALRLNGQTVQAAVYGALGIRDGENVNLPPDLVARVMARTTQMLRENEALDPVTAAAAALDELTDVRRDGWFGGGNRRFSYTDAGAAFSPAQAVPTAPPRVPQGAMIDDETGEVVDAQGNVIGRVRR